jgi:hypothetical protein
MILNKGNNYEGNGGTLNGSCMKTLIVSYLTYILCLMSHLLYFMMIMVLDDNENTHLIKLKDVRYFGKQIKVCLWIEYTPHMILI